MEIDYTDAGTYPLTVVSGTGGGTITPGTQVAIVADAPATGSTWVYWTGDTAWIYEPLVMSTIMEMPPRSATVTATYLTSVSLTVNSGTGSGTYYEGLVVAIAADAPTTGGWIFDGWVGDVGGVAVAGARYGELEIQNNAK